MQALNATDYLLLSVVSVMILLMLQPDATIARKQAFLERVRQQQIEDETKSISERV